MTKEERIKKFVQGLFELAKETGIAVGGCGCCGSPYLIDLDEDFSELEPGSYWNDEKRAVETLDREQRARVETLTRYKDDKC